MNIERSDISASTYASGHGATITRPPDSATTRPHEREPAPPVLPLKRAVIYLRVSTEKQAMTDSDPEGLSLPAQRDTCLRKAAELGAEVIDEYVDRGESAKTTDRPMFQAMIKRVVTKRDVDYVILDKVNRFARNRRDDANVLFELRRAGAAVVSVKENVDDTPAGALLHGILATLAEYESRNNGTEALKGMTRKAQVGGTPGRAPVGYRNIRLPVAGQPRGLATVEIDPERAPHVRWAFEQYATGEWSTQRLTDALEVRGLRSMAVGAKPEKPLPKSRVHNLLSNRYYTGVVTFQGVQYPGGHEPLIDVALFTRVQDVLAAKARSGERTQRHHHYLVGTLFCDECGCRFVFSRIRGKGGLYDYFRCLGPENHVVCSMRYIRADWIESRIEREWASIQVSETDRKHLRSRLVDAMCATHKDVATEARAGLKRRERLNEERTTLLRAHLAGAVPLDLLKVEQDRIARELAEAQAAIDATATEVQDIEATLDRVIDIVGNCHRMYVTATPVVRRKLNQAFFERIQVGRDELTPEVASPFSELRAVTRALGRPPDRQGSAASQEADHRRGPQPDPADGGQEREEAPDGASSSSLQHLVREGGLEPPHPFGHRNLNPARLPIPPLAREVAPVNLPHVRGPRPTGSGKLRLIGDRPCASPRRGRFHRRKPGRRYRRHRTNSPNLWSR